MKKFIASLIVVVMLCFSQAAYCAPFSVNGGDGGNDPSVMAITNPAYQAVSVPSGEYVVSGYAKCGAEVSVYMLNANGAYELCVTPSYVGASGIFFRTVSLYPGRNTFVVRAQLGDSYKQVRFDAICFAFGNIY